VLVLLLAQAEEQAPARAQVQPAQAQAPQWPVGTRATVSAGVGAGTREDGALPPVLEDAEDLDGGTRLHPPGEERGRSTSMEDGAAAEEPPAA
jgi:hypothetical protein